MSELSQKRRLPIRLLVLAGVVLVIGLVFAAVDLSPDLEHLDTEMLSGPEQGNYHAIVDRLSRAASADNGHVGNRSTAGTVDALARLAAAADSCDVEFALAQDGIAPPEGSGLELIARMPVSESMFVIGPDAARLTRFAEIAGMRIGVGPKASGTDHLARLVFGAPDFKPLALKLENHGLDEQLALLRSGGLDLAVMVVDEDAAIIRRAVRELGMQIADFDNWDVVARQHSFLWHGRIGAGQYDAVRMLPPGDRRVLRVDTLVVGNRCAGRTETMALVSLLVEQLPDLVDHNRKRGRSDLYPLSSASESYWESGGPGVLERHVPWLVDIMAPSNWVYVVMSISVIFNLMTFWHRFRLWRLDANRDKADAVIREILGAQLTPEEIRELEPTAEHRKRQAIADLDEALHAYDALRARCQIQANSMLVPMGQEGSYRYQEDQMEEMLTAVRVFRGKLGDAPAGPGEEE